MTDKASPAGWVVQVTIPAPAAPSSQEGGRWNGPQMLGAPSFEYCNVAIASPDKAVEATRKCLGKSRAPSGSCRQPKLLRWASRMGRSNQHERMQEAPYPLVRDIVPSTHELMAAQKSGEPGRVGWGQARAGAHQVNPVRHPPPQIFKIS